MKFLKQLMIIFSISFVAELMEFLIPLPIAASVYGLVLMLVGLITKIIPLEKVECAADFLVEIMPVLFIPAAVGLIDMVEELKEMFLPILLVVGPVTLLVMIVAGKTTDKLIKEEKSDE